MTQRLPVRLPPDIDDRKGAWSGRLGAIRVKVRRFGARDTSQGCLGTTTDRKLELLLVRRSVRPEPGPPRRPGTPGQRCPLACAPCRPARRTGRRAQRETGRRRRSGNDEAGHRLSPVGDGGRGLGPQGGGLRDPQRAGQLPGVRRRAPSARRRCRGPAARRGVRVRARDRAGSPARRFLLRYRRLGQAGRGGPGPEPGLRHQGRRYARPAVGPGVVRRRHQLPRDLGHHTRTRWPRYTGSFAPADASG